MERKILSKQDVTTVLVGFGLVIAVFVFSLTKSASDDAKKSAIADSHDISESKAPLPTMGTADLRALLAADSSTIRIADLRSDPDFRLEHVTGSVSAASPEQVSGIGVPDGGTLVLIPSGNVDTDRSVSDALSGSGKRYVFVNEGLSGWKVAGGTVVTEPNLSSPIDRSKVTLIKADAWKNLFAKNDIAYRILDVRPSDESSKGAVSGALNIPYSDLENRRVNIPIASNIALCAGNADDAFRGAVRLFDLGFFSVKALDGSCSDIVTR